MIQKLNTHVCIALGLERKCVRFSVFLRRTHAAGYVKVYLSHSYVTCRMRACDVRVFAMRTLRFECYSTQPSHRSGKILAYQGRRQER